MVTFTAEREAGACKATLMVDGEDGGCVVAHLDKGETLEMINTLLAVYNQL